MRLVKLMGPPDGVATAAPTIRGDIHKCQFNMTLWFVNQILHQPQNRA